MSSSCILRVRTKHGPGVHGPPVMDQVHGHFFKFLLEGFAPGPWTLQKQK